MEGGAEKAGDEGVTTTEPAATVAEAASAGRRTRRQKRAERKAAAKTAAKPAPPVKTEPKGPSEVGEQGAALLRAVHPRQAVVTALAVAAGAFASGRPTREVAVAGAAVVVVSAALGLINDAGDGKTDRTSGATGKPVADGHLPAGNASFLGICLLVVGVPLAVQNGTVAAAALAAYVVLALFSRTALRRGWLSWLPWAASFAMLPAFLSYGGWGAGRHGGPPTWAMTAVVAALGIGVHVFLALPDLVADNKARIRHAPLRVALRIGARPLLVLTVLYLVAAAAGIVVVGATVGLHR